METRQNTLTITGLRTEFLTPEGPLAAVDGVDLALSLIHISEPTRPY